MGSKKLFFAVVFLCASAFAQNGLVPVPPVFLGPASGPRLGANLTVSFCTSVATLNNCLGGSAYAQAYADSTNSNPINQSINPLKTDALGNAPAFFAAPGLYSFAVSGPGVGSPQGPYQITVSCIPGVTCVAPGANNAFTGNNTHSGTETFNGPVTASGNVTATAGQNTLSAYSLDNVLWVDGIKYTTLASCYAAIPSTGGTCEVPPNYSETLAANLVFSKNNAGFHFNGPYTITQGSFQVIMNAGLTGAFIRAPNIQLPASVGWQYSGSGAAFLIGGSSTSSTYLVLENPSISIFSGTASSAIGLDIINTANFLIINPTIQSPNSATGGAAIVLDGTGTGFTGGVIVNPIFINPPFNGIKFTGDGTSHNANQNTIVGGRFANGCATSGVGLNFVFGSGNTVTNIDLESCPTAVNFAATSVNQGNDVSIWNSGNTTDVVFGAGVLRNRFTANVVSPVVTDSSGNNTNSVQYFGNYKQDASGNVIASGRSTFSAFAFPSSLFASNTAPTVTSGFNTNGTIGAGPNGTVSFFVTIGNGTAGSTGVIGLPTVANGWNCLATNQTRAALVSQTANSTTSVTLTNFGTTFAATNWTNGDAILVNCFGR